MIIYIILIISLAENCSSMPPTNANITKPVQTTYLQKFGGKNQQPPVNLKSDPMSTANPWSEITDADEMESFSKGVQSASLPFELKDKKTMRLCTKVPTPKRSVAIEYEGGEEAEEAPPKWYKLETNMETYEGPKVYNQFIPGHNIRAYPHLNSDDVADANLTEKNEKLENIYRQYKNFENEWKTKHVPKLRMFNVASLYTTDDERFEMDIIAETTSEAPPSSRRPKLRFRHMNIIRDFKSYRVSHVAPAAGLLRMVARPVGNFKLGQKKLSNLRNKDLGHKQ